MLLERLAANVPIRTPHQRSNLFQIGLLVLVGLVASCVQEVRSFQANSSIAEPSARADKADVEARALLTAGEKLLANWTEASFLEAIDKFKDAHRLWTTARNFRDVARASRRRGDAYAALGKNRQAIDSYETAATEAQRAGDQQLASEALSEAGRLFSYLGDNQRATQYLERELNRYETNKAPTDSTAFKHGHATVISHLGEVYYSRGNLVKAFANFTRALQLFQEIGDKAGEAHSLLFRGYTYAAFGETQKAAGQFSQALVLARTVNNRLSEARALTAIGLVYSFNQEDEKGIRLHDEAMNIFRAIGDQQNVAITYNAKGQAYEHMGEYQLALDQYMEGLKLGEANDSRDYIDSALYQIGNVYRSMEKRSQALYYYERSLAASRAAGKILAQANVLGDMALLSAAEGNRSQALKQFQETIRVYSRTGEIRGRTIALNNLGDLLLSGGEPERALTHYREGLALSETGQEKTLEITTLYNIAQALRSQNKVDEALKHIERSVQIVEEVRTNVASPDFRASFFAVARRNYSLNIALLMQLEREHPGNGFAVKALLVSENARARSLVDILSGPTAKRRDVDPALWERKRDLEAMLRYQAGYQLQQSGGGNNTDTREIAAQLDSLRAEWQDLEAKLWQAGPSPTSTVPLNIEDIQRELGNDTALLEYVLIDDKSYLWTVTHDSVVSYELPGQVAIESAAREVYELLTARQKQSGQELSQYLRSVEESDKLYVEKAAHLSDLLVGPAIHRLQTKRLLVVTEGILQYIPFDALPVQGQPLLATHEIISVPSISTLAAIRRETRRVPDPGKLIAVLADPVFDLDDARVRRSETANADSSLSASIYDSNRPALRAYENLRKRNSTVRLLNTSDEAEAILKAAPKGSAMVATGFEANRETVMSPGFGQYRIVHLATHGLINNERPELSGILLSLVDRNGAETNGFLQLHDIYDLDLSADLVVLSACDTGLGKNVEGEGLIGLTRGFMYAGARSVVATLWKVDDLATATLMNHFYKAMLQDGMSPPAALRSAKEAMRREKRWQAPYFWAGFVLQGEYDQRISVEQPTSSLVLLWAAPSLLLVGPIVFFLLRRRSTRR